MNNKKEKTYILTIMTAEKAFFLYCSLKKAVSFSLTAFLSMSHKTSTFLHKLRWSHTISLRETL